MSPSLSVSFKRQTDRQTETNKRTRNDHHPRDDDEREIHARQREKERGKVVRAYTLLFTFSRKKSQLIFRVFNPSRLKGFLSSFFLHFCAHGSAVNAHVTRDLTRVLHVKRDNTRGTFYLLSVESIRET